jgi:tRNA nucleotidyltransferase (CCA-adding enzyme)
MESCWEHFEHGADVGVRGIAASKAGAFEQAALALVGLLTDPAAVRPLQAVPIVCSAPDDELLLLDWLNALVSEMAVRRMLFATFEVSLDAGRLEAVALGEPIDPRRHQAGVEVKGATCTELRVARTAEGGWLAQTVVDV